MDVYLIYYYYRNRFEELKRYFLDLDEYGDVKDFHITPRQVACMKATGSIELPPSFIHGIFQVDRWTQELVCDRFKVSSQFPNNIVLLTGNRVMYCTAFSQETDAKDEHALRFYLQGYLFKGVNPCFYDPCSSSRIGWVHADRLDASNSVMVTGMELVGKCFVHARGHDAGRPEPAIDPLGTDVKFHLRQFQASRDVTEYDHLLESVANAWKRFKATDNSYGLDYWWVQSLVLPGRYTNHFQ
jgi:hypothetical protein